VTQLLPEERHLVQTAWDWSTSRTKVSAASIHGPTHWRRVALLGLRISQREGADGLVVCLFAACHDVARVHDGRDLEHGPRAAEWIADELAPRLALDPDRLQKWLCAVRNHTEGDTTPDPTIGSCWDADRLDLVRIGFPIDPAKLSTATARDPAVQDAARRLWARARRFRLRAGLPVWEIPAGWNDDEVTDEIPEGEES
jgi:uncharacterized protein